MEHALKCGDSDDVHNYSKKDKCVFVEIEDKCAGDDGPSVEIYDKDNKQIGRYGFEKGKNASAFFTIPPDGRLVIICNGSGKDGCKYQVTPACCE